MTKGVPSDRASQRSGERTRKSIQDDEETPSKSSDDLQLLSIYS